MEIIKVSRTNLLDTVKKNRDLHSEEYKLAEKGYWLQVEDALKTALKEVRKKGKTDVASKFARLQSPQNHTSDYDSVIKMLEFSVEDVIELDHQRFQQYVMDNWSWSGLVKSVNNFYASTVLGGAK
jgi:hypothetical protein